MSSTSTGPSNFIIEPAVTALGIKCVRADKIIHSTLIDKPMYENLQEADLVIADLTTSNANAIYELGVRHALRPHRTIVMADKGFAFPFDLNHLTILKYEHLGGTIGYEEVLRVKDQLKAKIEAVMARAETDGPVFLFLPALLGQGALTPKPAESSVPQDATNFADLMGILRQAKAAVKGATDWLSVIDVVTRLKNLQPNDPFVIQQLALATYKCRQPDPKSALERAREILSVLLPHTSSDPETVGLWGAIHKRLWEIGRSRADLDTGIRAYARGYFIRNDPYNGINFAFLLDVRAANAVGDEAVTDRVLARRTRREVVALCDLAGATAELSKFKGERGSDEDPYWPNASKVEALFGLGRMEASNTLRKLIFAIQPPPHPWMIESLVEQLAKLESLNPLGEAGLPTIDSGDRAEGSEAQDRA